MHGIRAIIILIFLSSTSALAQERFEFYTGIRQMSMGGVAVPTVNDETALLLNPAALGKLRDYFVTVADPEFETNTSAGSIANSDYFAAVNPGDVYSELLKPVNFGEYVHTKAQVLPSFVIPNFGVGLFGKYEMNARSSADGSSIRMDYMQDWAAVFGFNFRLWSGRVKLGFNLKAINRVEIAEDFDTSSVTVVSDKQNADEGIGIGTDVGLILALPWKLLPSLSAVWRDVGNTRFDFKDGLFLSKPDSGTRGVPRTITQSLDVGVAIFPITGKRSRMTIAVEVRDIFSFSDEFNYWRRLHAGIEWNFYDALFLRAGYSQRYITGGLEIASGNWQLQLGTYGEEVGDAVIDEQQEDRRYGAKFAYRF